jgi:ABC-type antimicrobial peptide transport system permease subunit
MSRWSLLKATLFYHWRANLAVGLGVVAATAVITGALVVGDSVQTSLLDMHLDRLGQVDMAVGGRDRFVREDLAAELQAAIGSGAKVAPLMMMRGSLETGGSESVGARTGMRVGGVMVYGVDSRFWDLTQHGNLPVPAPGEVVLSEGVAAELGSRVSVGQQVRLWMELPNAIPRDTLLGERDDDTIDMVLDVKGVVGPDDPVARRGVGRFDLNPSQQLPKLAFVALETLQETLVLNKRRVRNREQRRFDNYPARVNTLVVAGGTPQAVSDALAQTLSLEDLGLSLRKLEKHGYVALESNRMVLDDTIVAAAGSLPGQSRVLVHLANRLSNAEDPSRYSMYSIVGGLVHEQVAAAPFGPFAGGGSDDVMSDLPDDSIVINRWLADDLGLERGGRLTMTYHLVGSHGELPEEQRTFRVHAVTELTGPADDRGLTPHVPGITDVRTFRDWRQPFKMDLDALTQRDDDYWDEFRATPKAFVTYKTATEMWQSRYGTATSLRMAVDPGDAVALKEVREVIEQGIDLSSLGLSVQPVKQHGVRAASGTTPFSGLFIGFSFFLIGAATILIGLLFRLGIERRVKSTGLMLALGLSPRAVLVLLAGEGLAVTVLGGVVGSAAGIGYAHLMVYGLTHWWVGAVGTSFLEVDVRASSLAAGFAFSSAVALAAIVVSARGLLKLPTRELLAGVVRGVMDQASNVGRSRRVLGISIGIAAAGLLCGVVVPDSLLSREAFSGLSIRIVVFFVLGISLLVSSLSVLSVVLGRGRVGSLGGRGLGALTRLGFRNAARHRSRSVLSVAMIASAAFLITAVAAGRRDPVAEWPDAATGGGGFLLVAESSQPLVFDPGSANGQVKLELADGLDERKRALLETMDLHSFRMKAGEESSCLNLYQTRLPTILGMSRRTIDRGGFRFVGAGEENPWKLLEEVPRSTAAEDGAGGLPVFPVMGDMNTLQYSLHKAVGDRIAYPDEENPTLWLEIVGMLDASVFQGVLVMSEQHFRAAFPDVVGFRYFLVGDSRFGAAGQVAGDLAELDDVRRGQAELLESKLGEYGFDAEPVVERLGRFLAVQNTYLSTFQVLGGLGLLLGTIGLATVMQRNVLERRSELALLRAVGYRRSGLRWLVLSENAFLLMWGLVSGTVSALLAMLPHLMTAGADVGELAGGLAQLLSVVVVVGMLAALLAVAEAVRTPVVASLRSE